MKKFKCPYCYETHTLEECTCKCTYSVLGAVQNCKYGYEKLKDGVIPPKTISKCLKCTSAALTVTCPHLSTQNTNTSTNYDWSIPRPCHIGTNMSIAVLGSTGAGKSNYIAVLINEIESKLSRYFDCALIPVNEKIKNLYNSEFYDPIYNKKTVVAKTARKILPPLVYSLNFMNPSNNRFDKSANLTFYDTAGEDLYNSATIAAEKGYIANADGIILLLDPLQIPAIREKLEGKIELPPKVVDATQIIETVVNVYRNVKKSKNVKIPVAVVFTKMDILAKYGILTYDSCLREESVHLENQSFVKWDFNNTQNEMKALIENYLQDGLEQKVKIFKDWAYFGVSALGTSPVGENNDIPEREFKPLRVLDPLLWLLAKNKYIKTT